MFSGAGGGLSDHGGQTRAAALGNDHAVRAHAFSRADDCAEIVRIGNFIADDDERRFAFFFGGRQNVLHGAVFLYRAHGYNALMGVGLAHHVQLSPVCLHHDDALTSRLGSNVSQRLVHFSLGNVNFINCAAGTERLNDSISAFYTVFRKSLLFHVCSFIYSN